MSYRIGSELNAFRININGNNLLMGGGGGFFALILMKKDF